MTRRQHSLRKTFVKEPSVLTHDANGGKFGISAREILTMNEDGLSENNMVRMAGCSEPGKVTVPPGIGVLPSMDPSRARNHSKDAWLSPASRVIFSARVRMSFYRSSQCSLRLSLVTWEQRALAAVGGPQALAAMLDSDVSRGLHAEDNMDYRAKEFGRNWMPVPDPKTWVQLFIDSFDDTTLIILIVSAIVSLAVSGGDSPSFSM